MAENYEIMDGIKIDQIDKEFPKDFDYQDPVQASLVSAHESQARQSEAHQS